MALNNSKHSLWVGVGKQILSFIVGVILAAFILGRNSQKINDVVTWKQHTSPIIDQMQRDGTVSFGHFFKNYEKTQTSQEARLHDLELRMREVEKKVDPP